MASRRATKPGMGATEGSKPPPSARTTEQASRETGKRSRISKPPLWVEEVGSGVTRMPAKIGTPRLAKGTRDLAKAPLGPREAFLLSRIDGATSAADLADLTGMPRDEVDGVLERMVRLGLVVLA